MSYGVQRQRELLHQVLQILTIEGKRKMLNESVFLVGCKTLQKKYTVESMN